MVGKRKLHVLARWSSNSREIAWDDFFLLVIIILSTPSLSAGVSFLYIYFFSASLKIAVRCSWVAVPSFLPSTGFVFKIFFFIFLISLIVHGSLSSRIRRLLLFSAPCPRVINNTWATAKKTKLIKQLTFAIKLTPATFASFNSSLRKRTCPLKTNVYPCIHRLGDWISRI